ncbi:uncharacterized protein LOC134943683 [Pseudophryne corroboree]|uniref:uncharacterized protein LOC134943683 n=1 Tax=Pseudophryne corroboree TaxID=495146 RepID=UPI0030815F01
MNEIVHIFQNIGQCVGPIRDCRRMTQLKINSKNKKLKEWEKKTKDFFLLVEEESPSMREKVQKVNTPHKRKTPHKKGQSTLSEVLPPKKRKILFSPVKGDETQSSPAEGPAGDISIAMPAGYSDIPKNVGESAIHRPVEESDIYMQTVESDIAMPAGESNIATPAVESDIATRDVESDIAMPAGESDTGSPAGESDIAMPAGESDTGSPAGESDIAMRAGEPDIARPTGESNIATPVGESDIATPDVESDIAMPAGESHIARPTGESNIATPVGESDIATRDVESELARPAGESHIARPAGQSDIATRDGESELARPAGDFHIADHFITLSIEDRDIVTQAHVDRAHHETHGGNIQSIEPGIPQTTASEQTLTDREYMQHSFSIISHEIQTMSLRMDEHYLRLSQRMDQIQETQSVHAQLMITIGRSIDYPKDRLSGIPCQFHLGLLHLLSWQQQANVNTALIATNLHQMAESGRGSARDHYDHTRTCASNINSD